MTLLINNVAPTVEQLAAIRADLGLGTAVPGTPNGVAMLDAVGDLPVIQLPNSTAAILASVSKIQAVSIALSS